MKNAWSRKELRTAPDGYYDLAAAVIEQWKQDGQPRGDREGVEMWAELLQSHRRMMHSVMQGTVHLKRKK